VAAGVNYADCIVRMGLYSSAKAFVGLPITPGFEVCGEVIEVGTSVTDIGVGDTVIASTLFGGYSEVVVVDQQYVFPKPVGFTDVQAAGLMATYLTAYYALYELAHPRSGQHILIHSAAGGVGTMLVQLAHALGLTVTGVVGAPHKTEFLEAFSPAHIIDKSNEDLWSKAHGYAPEGFDVICDANGVSTLGESYRHLRRPGKLVVYGFASMLPKTGGRPNWFKLATSYLRTPRFNPLDLTTDSKSILAFNLSYLFERTEVLGDAMVQLHRLIDTGHIAPPHCTAFSVEDVALAHREIESGTTVGKLVLTF
jgi:NADPH:quinone reductase-like Zn-dependent oxidoreductase